MKKRRDDIQEELEKLSPSLARLRGESSGFKVPEDYFQKLTGEIMGQVHLTPAPEAEPEQADSRSWRQPLMAFWRALLQPRYAMALATVVVLIVAGLFWLRPFPPAATENIAWKDISTEEMTAYIEANIQEFALEGLVELAPGLEQRSILSGTDIETDELDGYLEDILEDMEIEELENLF